VARIQEGGCEILENRMGRNVPVFSKGAFTQSFANTYSGKYRKRIWRPEAANVSTTKTAPRRRMQTLIAFFSSKIKKVVHSPPLPIAGFVSRTVAARSGLQILFLYFRNKYLQSFV